ncbi:MAG TPA: hypothetical protein VE714_12695 [Gemmatimonadales bacterium]|jgi:hypothetical protein|nr:hypothetical protein [Gemmatimonadales bacterium]
MTARGKRTTASSPPSASPGTERRRNRPLREVLDDLISHTRDIARRSKTMTAAELDYAQQRLEWLADEVWRLSTGEVSPPE